MAPAEALAADPLPDAVAVMQLAVAASAHRAGGIKVGPGSVGSRDMRCVRANTRAVLYAAVLF